MNRSQFFRNLSVAVLPSVVAVEDRNREEFWIGSIIHKSSAGIFILTQSKFIKANYQLFVHFHDNLVAEAERLVYDPTFAVLHVAGQHASSTTAQFRDQAFSYSEALCVTPKTETIFQSIPGFIPVPSCEASDDKGANPRSDDYFLFMCHHEDTPTITPAPVFHKEGNVTGFIIRDCAVHGDPKKVDVHMKICLKSAKVVAWLKKIANGEDWKKGLELKSKELERLKLQKKKELERKELESKAAGKRRRR